MGARALLTPARLLPLLTILTLAVALVAAASAHAAPRTITFTYDRTQPLGYLDRGLVTRDGKVAIRDVVFESAGDLVDGFLVLVPGKKRQPGIVMVHGSGGSRRDLVGQAVELARRGAVVLTITAPSSVRQVAAPTTLPQLLSQTRTSTVGDVVAVRRAADALARLRAVDPKRIGYLGWSAGAKTGTFVAATDRRFRALALLSGGAAKLSEFVAQAPRPSRALVRQELGLVDPLRYVALARPGTLLLADGRKDTVVPRPALENMIAAAPARTTVRWYAAGHALTVKAYREAFTWLLARLG